MYTIRPAQQRDVEPIRRFTEREIGEGYYSSGELADMLDRSQKNGIICSFVLESERREIAGIRLSFPPGHWESGKGQGLDPSCWPHPLHETAYFQSIFLAARVQGQGWGGRMSVHALLRLHQMGAKGVVCHAWKESPNNSSLRYLLKLGFVRIRNYPLYWKHVNYHCTRCQKPPCQCTAQEMYLDLERTHEHFTLA